LSLDDAAASKAAEDWGGVRGIPSRWKRHTQARSMRATAEAPANHRADDEVRLSSEANDDDALRLPSLAAAARAVVGDGSSRVERRCSDTGDEDDA